MKIKIKSLDVRWYIFYCASLIYAVLQINIVMYMCLVIQLMYIAKSRKKNRNLIEISNLLLITLFLPDNYVIIPIVMLTFFWCIIKRGLRKKIVFWITIVSIYCMLNICINQVHFNNILFSVIYTLPFFMMGYEMEYLISDKKVVDDTHNQEPLFYEKYPGSLNDISQLQFMLDKAFGYGYKKIGFILDRGYFSSENIQYMDKCGYSFVIMVKGMASLVNELVLEHKGTFESKRVNNIYEYGVYGKTVKHRLYAGDKKERYFHLYHSISKESAERAGIENRLNQMTLYLKKYQNKVKEFGPGFEKYFNLHYDEKTQAFVLSEERCSVVERELDLAGYFCIITSEKMSAKEAIELYKSHDTSEKLFRGDKSYLGNKSIRVYSEESARAKIFVEVVAMILRCKMYIKLKEEMKKLEKKPNYMTVPAALKELEKIEMVRQLDNVYRLDHAVTANQKTILNAFGLDANHIKYYASELSKELKKAE